MKELGAKAAFKGYRGYPCVLCTSVNEEVVHGIPSAERECCATGTLFRSITGVIVDGYYGDSAITVAVGQKVARTPGGCSMSRKRRSRSAIEEVQAGSYAGRCRCGGAGSGGSRRVQRGPRFCGHGIGTRMHEDPQVPNLRAAWPGHETSRWHGAGDRADGECRQAGRSGIERWLDGGNGRWKFERAL